MATANSIAACLDANVYNLFPLPEVADCVLPTRPKVGYVYARWGNIYLEDERRIIHKLGEIPAGMEAVICESVDGLEDGYYVGEPRDVRRVRRLMERLEAARLTADQQQSLDDELARQECYDAEYDVWCDMVDAIDWDGGDHGC